MSGIPATRYGERLAAARGEAAAAGLDALLIGVGADLRYLTGYEAMPLERLTMLLVPAADAAPLTLIAPRLEAAPARLYAAAASGAVEVVTWEETDDPMRLVATRLGDALGRDAADLRAVAVNDTLRASFVLGLQRVLPGAAFVLASSVLRRLRMTKDADEVSLLRAAATRRTGWSSRSRPGRSSGGPRRTSRARSATGCSRRVTSTRSSGSSPRGQTARRPITTPASGSSAPASRSSSTSVARWAATARTSRARSG